VLLSANALIDDGMAWTRAKKTFSGGAGFRVAQARMRRFAQKFSRLLAMPSPPLTREQRACRHAATLPIRHPRPSRSRRTAHSVLPFVGRDGM